MALLSAVSHHGRIIAAIIVTMAFIALSPGRAAEATAPIVHDVSTCSALVALGAESSTSADTIDLTSDLDCTGVTFAPLYSGGFSGTFNGQGHSVSNLAISTGQWAGFFAKATGATIENLNLVSGTVSGDQYIGALAGEASGVSISGVTSNIDVTCTVECEDIAGLIGELNDTGTSVIQDVAATGNLVASSDMGGGYIGGLVGYLNASNGGSITIERTSAAGNVSLTGDDGDRIGGMIGEVDAVDTTASASVIVQDSYATGEVSGGTGGDAVGGLIGSVVANTAGSAATISVARTYASGAVTGSQGVGGLFGAVDANGGGNADINVTDSFAAGRVTATDVNGGGIAGTNYYASPGEATYTNDYYDGPGTGQSVCSSAGGLSLDCTRINTGTQPNYFLGNYANAPLNGWSFTYVWTTVSDGYPILIPLDDGVGIGRAIEEAGPSSGDANGDGIPDAAEPYVGSLPDSLTGHYAVAQTSCGALNNVSEVPEDTTAGQTDAAYKYPAGLLSFEITGCSPGATATITQYYYGLTDPSQFTMRNWNSESNAYATIPGATLSMVTNGGQTAIKVVFQVTDGSSLDQDGTVNGTIVDPSGPAIGALGIPDTGMHS